MKKLKKASFMEWNKNVLVSSLKKVNLGIIPIVILDALFYFISGCLAVFWLLGLQAKMMSISIPSNIISLGYEKAQQIANEAQSFYYLTIFSFILLVLAIIFVASILKGIIWAKTTGTKVTLRLISKFLLLNLMLMGFIFFLIFLASLIAEPASANLAMIIIIASGIYFTNAVYTVFMKQQSLKSVPEALRLGIAKIHFFAAPYILFFALMFAVVYLSNLAGIGEMVFFVVARLYSLLGIDILAAQLFRVQIAQIVLAASFFANPLLLLSFAFFRHYISALVFELRK